MHGSSLQPRDFQTFSQQILTASVSKALILGNITPEKRTKKKPLKMDVWNTSQFPFLVSAYFQLNMLVLGSVSPQQHFCSDDFSEPLTGVRTGSDRELPPRQVLSGRKLTGLRGVVSHEVTSDNFSLIPSNNRLEAS